MKVYKVVCPIQSKYGSTSIVSCSQFHLFYELNKTTKPNVGKIFVFKHPNDAIVFATYMKSVDANTILECNTPEIFPLPRSFICPTNADIYLNAYWNLKNPQEEVFQLIKAFHPTEYPEHLVPPVGTFCCNELTPTSVYRKL